MVPLMIDRSSVVFCMCNVMLPSFSAAKSHARALRISEDHDTAMLSGAKLPEVTQP